VRNGSRVGVFGSEMKFTHCILFLSEFNAIPLNFKMGSEGAMLQRIFQEIDKLFFIEHLQLIDFQ
jgi:hypothetical protein